MRYRDLIRAGVVLGVQGLICLPVSSDEPSRSIQGWGEIVDPDGDCQFKLEDGKLSIAVPASLHDLSIETGDMNAPRVVQNIKEDFIVDVKVSGNFEHGGKSTSKEYLGYHGAGLLLWQDQRNYIRLERAAIVDQGDNPVHYVNFEYRKDGKKVKTNIRSALIPDAAAVLRLEKRGNRVFGLASLDGAKWLPFEPFEATFDGPLQLGFGTINTTTERFKAEFAELEIYKKEPK